MKTLRSSVLGLFTILLVGACTGQQNEAQKKSGDGSETFVFNPPTKPSRLSPAPTRKDAKPNGASSERRRQN
jgi:hypothetical protein